MTHPMTPPPEQFGEWMAEAVKRNPGSPGLIASYVADQAYAAGADAELEACCGWLEGEDRIDYAAMLRASRRPRPAQDAFTKELALDACASALAAGRLSGYEAAAIRIALEATP